MDSKKLGGLGEKIACRFLENKGYKILDKNYYEKSTAVSKGEIDLVAEKDRIISFIEVKTSKSVPLKRDAFFPEDRVNFKKQKQLIKLSQMWLLEKKIPLDSKWQIDVVSVRVDLNSKKAGIRHIRNAFC